jgi:hypothetical protein
LAIDRNNDGIINQASELLSGAELSASAQNRIIQRLAYFDANGDGRMDIISQNLNSANTFQLSQAA